MCVDAGIFAWRGRRTCVVYRQFSTEPRQGLRRWVSFEFRVPRRATWKVKTDLQRKPVACTQLAARSWRGLRRQPRACPERSLDGSQQIAP